MISYVQELMFINYEEEGIFMKANINNSIRLINSVYSLNNQARILLIEQ